MRHADRERLEAIWRNHGGYSDQRSDEDAESIVILVMLFGIFKLPSVSPPPAIRDKETT